MQTLFCLYVTSVLRLTDARMRVCLRADDGIVQYLVFLSSIPVTENRELISAISKFPNILLAFEIGFQIHSIRFFIFSVTFQTVYLV